MILVNILSGNLLVKITLFRINSLVRYTMPVRSKGTFLGCQIRRAAIMQNRRAQRTEGQIQQDNTDARVRMTQLHQAESEDV